MITSGSRITLPDGRDFEVVGDPEDYGHGPFGFGYSARTPHTVLVSQPSTDEDNPYGDSVVTWSEPVAVAVHGWAPVSTSEPKVAGRDQVTVDLQLFVPPLLVVNLRRVS